MVRLPSTRADRDADMDSTMTPMIDVVFLLLIFFVWTAGTQLVEYILPSEMRPQLGNQESNLTEPLPEQDFDNVLIRLRWDGDLPDWTINDQEMKSADEVATTLRTLADINIDAPIIVHPDANVPMGYVIEMYDVAKLAGFVKVSFALNNAL
ncbi:MAG: ExbD/TolR family protein [Pirellulaceae bacterium]